jgi:hypothetical protein
MESEGLDPSIGTILDFILHLIDLNRLVAEGACLARPAAGPGARLGQAWQLPRGNALQGDGSQFCLGMSYWHDSLHLASLFLITIRLAIFFPYLRKNTQYVCAGLVPSIW